MNRVDDWFGLTGWKVVRVLWTVFAVLSAVSLAGNLYLLTTGGDAGFGDVARSFGATFTSALLACVARDAIERKTWIAARRAERHR